MDPRRDSGLSVAPVYEGWEPNPDGTVSLYFGYMNRNWKEELDIPIGADNAFAPGEPDRGQPSHFLPRRHKQVFSVVVPKGFSGALTWTLTLRGNTESVPGSLKPEQQIDVHKDTETANTPPVVKVPGPLKAKAGRPLELRVQVTDDGLPKRPNRPDPEGRTALHVTWAKYRGPGPVAFTRLSTPVQDGSAVTTVTFSAPGDYIVQATADDGSVYLTSQGQNVPGFACCWTPANIAISVE
jgi:hypothetical protein